jgi:O-antigen/teichoic acid export membrane protein
MSVIVNSRRLINNATMSVLQTVSSCFLIFFLYRFLFQNIGPEQLGLWSIVLASTSVTRLSELGFTGSVVKYVAKYSAKDVHSHASSIIQTATITIACFMGLVLFACYPVLQYILKGVIPATSISVANGILPLAIASLWLNTVGGVFQSALDGLQRMSLRSSLMIVCNLIYFITAIFLTKAFGVIGLAISQVFQSFLLLILCWFFLRRIIDLPYLPVLWTKASFNEMFRYAFNFQIISIAALLFDPITKFLMSKYAGLSNVGYYEMASQMVVKFRSLLVAATQSIVPAVADLHERVPEKITLFYSQTFRIVFCLSLPYYVGVVISLPAISLLWLGSINQIFIFLSFLLTGAWGLNTLSVPAYFCNMGTGDLRDNTISHIAMGLLNLLFGIALGQYYGVFGIACSTFISLSFSSIYILISFHRRHHLPFSVCFKNEDLPFWIYSFLALIIAIILVVFGNLKVHNLSIVLGVPFGYIFIFFILLWFHSFRSTLFGIFSKLH